MNPSFLEPNVDQAQMLMDKFLLEDSSPLSHSQASSGGVQYTSLVPKPGFCVKMKSENKEKVFINVCESENVPEPKDMSESDLIALLESDDPTGFRIPMSIGEPHAEMDKSGAGCTAYDVIIHPKFLKKVEKSKIFQAFFLMVTREGIEGKYDIEINKEYTILKNRKFIGKLLEQNVRTKSKPFIMDMGEQPAVSESSPLIQEVQKHDVKKGPEPKFTIVQEPSVGHPEFLVAEIHLPQVKTAGTLTLDVGEDRILLNTRSNIYYLDIYLPYNIVQEEVGSQFHRGSKILTITMPVQSEP